MLKIKIPRAFVLASLTLLLIITSWALSVPAKGTSPQKSSQPLFNDSHFHLTNYVQRGIKARDFLKMVDNQVGRVALFGIPLQQNWNYFVDGKREPDYYLLSDAELYYYSFVDAMIAREYQRLSPQQRQHFDPMITGFNPADMYAADHITRVLRTFPGVFTGIGEFSIHKEVVSSKVAGSRASLSNPALHEVLDVAGEIGLVTILHCDIDTMRPAPGPRPAYLDEMEALLKTHKNTAIIWAHTGLGRFVAPRSNHLNYLEEILSNPEYNHVAFDLSWDEVAKYVAKDPQSWANLVRKYPDRFIFGTDSVAPKNESNYFKTYNDYKPFWDLLDEKTSFQVRLANYERIFDAAKRKVRAWEAKQAEATRQRAEFWQAQQLEQEQSDLPRPRQVDSGLPLG